jgi:integrase
MKKAQSTCVFKRNNGVYYFRRAVPLDLVDRVGKREWKSSLRTTDPMRAHIDAAPLWERTERQIAQLRGNAAPNDLIDPELPASDEQVVELATALFSRRATMSIGRLDGRIGAGRVRGKAAQETLSALEAELAELEAGSPLIGEHRVFAALLPEIETRTRRAIDPDSGLAIDLRKIQWQIWKDVLQTNIAQVKGDDVAVARMNSARRTEPTLRSLIELFRKHRTSDWSPNTHTKFNAVSTVLLNILEPTCKLSNIDREVARELGDIIHDLPPNYGKRSILSGLSAREAAARARALDLPRLGRKTVQDYYNHISSVFEFAVHEDLMDRNPMKGLSVYAEKASSNRHPFTPSELQKIFNAPVFAGCVDDEHSWRRPASTQVKRGRYWVPIIALHTGMRLNEVCMLRKGDIQVEDSIPFIQVTDSGGRRLKTINARRKIPMHPQLLRLGLLEWAQRVDGDDDQDLFPELPMDKTGARSNAFSKWFGRLRKSVGVDDPGKTFHSFRHLFEDLLRDADVSLENNERIMGWSNDHIQRVYGAGPSLKKLAGDVRKVDLSFVSLAHLMPR